MWKVHSIGPKVRICSDNFRYDACLELSGDFLDKQKKEYAQRIANKLNNRRTPILEKLFHKLICNHSWIIYDPIRVGKDIPNIYFAECHSCGKLKKFKVKK